MKKKFSSYNLLREGVLIFGNKNLPVSKTKAHSKDLKDKTFLMLYIPSLEVNLHLLGSLNRRIYMLAI